MDGLGEIGQGGLVVFCSIAFCYIWIAWRG